MTGGESARYVARNARVTLFAAVIFSAAGACFSVAFRDWRLAVVGLVVALAALVLTRLGALPGGRRILISDGRVVVFSGSALTTVTASDVKSCRIDWSFGTPLSGRRRTRYDAWALTCLNGRGDILIRLDDAQDFGPGRLYELAARLHVPCSVPDGWREAQGRWLAFRVGALG